MYKAMKKIYMLIALLTLGIAGIQAQEIEVPEDAPRETWQLVYDDYRSISYDYIPEYRDLTMDVTVVRGENCLYIQGLAKSCATSWVKIGLPDDDVLNNQLLLWSNQPVEADGERQYLNTGTLRRDVDTGHTFTIISIRCLTSSEPLIFKRNLESDRLEYEAPERAGFWLDKELKKAGGLQEYTIWQIDGVQEPFITEEKKFPEAEVYVHPRLIDTTDVQAGINAMEDESNAPVYTLSGIKADRNHLAPGVYVSRGKKIVIK
jgi:hypothetical protein